MKYIRKHDRATAWQLAHKRLKEIDENRKLTGDFDTIERLRVCGVMHATWFPGVDKY